MTGATLPICSICEGSEQRLVVAAQGNQVIPCSCKAEARLQRVIANAGIPPGLQYSSLSARSWTIRTPAERAAHSAAQRYVDTFPSSAGTGLCFFGERQGLKTTLAVGLLLALMQRYNLRGLFCRYRVVLRQLRSAYHREIEVSEEEILLPFLNADVLLVDELGGGLGVHGFAADAFAYVLDSRYRAMQPTIITTNYPCQPACARPEATLGDRIGNHLLSRLTEVSSVITLPYSSERTNAA